MKKFLVLLISFITFVFNAYAKDLTSEFASQENVRFYCYNGKYGLKTTEGTKLTEAVFDYAKPFQNDLSIVCLDGKLGLLNRQGEIVLPCEWTNIECGGSSKEPFIAYKGTWENPEYYLIDSDSFEIISLEYLSVSHFSDECAIVLNKDGYGVINAQGKLIVKTEHAYISVFSEGYAIVADQKTGEEYIIGKDGTEIPNSRFDRIVSLSSEIIIGKRGGKVGCQNIEGTLILDFKYDNIFQCGHETIAAKKDGKYWLFSFEGTLICDETFDDVKYGDISIVAVCKKGLWGFLDEEGNLLNEYQWKNIGSFAKNCAFVLENGSYRQIDINGSYISEEKWDEVSRFEEDVAAVCRNGRWGYVDTEGEIIIPPVYDANCAYPAQNEIIEIWEGNRYMYFDMQGRLLVSFCCE